MNFVQMQAMVNTWSHDADALDRTRPVIAGGRLIGFEKDGELFPLEGTHEEALRILRAFNFKKSIYYSSQLIQPKAKVATPRRILPQYRKERPSPVVAGEELEEYKRAMSPLEVGQKLEITYTEPRARVMLAVKRAAEALDINVRFLSGVKGIMRIERES